VIGAESPDESPLASAETATLVAPLAAAAVTVACLPLRKTRITPLAIANGSAFTLIDVAPASAFAESTSVPCLGEKAIALSSTRVASLTVTASARRRRARGA
jgi:ammonia channel protein AmtB